MPSIVWRMVRLILRYQRFLRFLQNFIARKLDMKAMLWPCGPRILPFRNLTWMSGWHGPI
ncbi:hypothetical protein ABW06_19445 [Pluralibacter gergoviae]|uniref:Uncharacterized protein n=1 Tax=Pluralibacter gergoviae TaxID=61647 RepID=A0A0J5KW97_PLUGE|nr:hypothetical protein ABW06_19445 [Pluralibacter gergoviae]